MFLYQILFWFAKTYGWFGSIQQTTKLPSPKVVKAISPDIMKDACPLQNTSANYNITSWSTFYSRPLNLVYNRTESLSNFTSKYGNLFLTTSKHLTLCLKFVRCLCRICKSYIPQVGFVSNAIFHWLALCSGCNFYILVLLRGVWEISTVSSWEDFPWVGSFQTFLGNSPEGLLETVHLRGVFSSRDHVKFLYFM